MNEKLEIIDQAIVKCNEAVKALMNGQNIAFCSLMVEIVRQLAILRESVVKDVKTNG